MKAKWAIIGLGFISSRHIQAIKEIGDELYLTCDIQGEADFKDWKEMIKSDAWLAVTHVAICTPNDLHNEMIKSCLHSGKIVLCEKPLTLRSKEIMAYEKTDRLFTVLQLRFNKDIIALKSVLDAQPPANHLCKLKVSVKREQSYWEGWKGEEKRSGGILFNLGIHYFDLLIHLLGEDWKVKWSNVGERTAKGEIDFNGSLIHFDLEITPDGKDQDRWIEIDNTRIYLSNKDNLSFEGLHTDVYWNLKLGNGIKPREAIKSIRLVENIRNVSDL